MRVPELDVLVARHDLNTHPFYLAWRAGTLPRAALATYAGEYAPFIEAIEIGWHSLGEVKHAAVEREHARLWDRFRAALGPATPTSCPESIALALGSRRAFADSIAAAGALYAFEAQQPSTARSKLDGLLAHYDFSTEDAAYFRIHVDDHGEREQLGALIARMTPGDFERAKQACGEMCAAMWSALDGVMRSVEPESCVR